MQQQIPSHAASGTLCLELLSWTVLALAFWFARFRLHTFVLELLAVELLYGRNIVAHSALDIWLQQFLLWALLSGRRLRLLGSGALIHPLCKSLIGRGHDFFLSGLITKLRGWVEVSCGGMVWKETTNPAS